MVKRYNVSVHVVNWAQHYENLRCWKYTPFIYHLGTRLRRVTNFSLGLFKPWETNAQIESTPWPILFAYGAISVLVMGR
jgi:hypothetical protein